MTIALGFCWFVAGVNIGVFVMCLMTAAKRGDASWR